MTGHLGVVEHVTAGEASPYPQFANPANQVSSHFGIGNGQGGMADGALEQYVDTDNQSWAQASGNAGYWSVETEGLPGDPLTQLQVAKFAQLYGWLAPLGNLPFVITDTVGQMGFITHSDGGPAWGNHLSCPGSIRAAQRQQILDLARTPITEGNMNALDPTSGGTWIVDPSDGHVECLFGAPYCGALNEPQTNRYNWQGVGQIAGITPFKDKNGQWGYAIIVHHNSAIQPGGEWFSPYGFARDGSNIAG